MDSPAERSPRRGSILRKLAALLLFLGLIASKVAAEPAPPPPGLADTAQSALKKFLPAIDSAAMKQTHGFAADDDFSDIKLGDPFEPLYLRSAALEGYKDGAPIDSLLSPSGNWFFPVNSKGRLACFVSVIQRKNGVLIEDKLGMAQLARVWASVNAAWPAEKGNTPRLVIVPSHQRFYFTVPQAKPPNLTRISIEQADTATPDSFKKLTPATKAIADLRSQGSTQR